MNSDRVRQTSPPDSPTSQGDSNVRFPKMQPSYICGNKACSVTGEPDEMFNIACNPLETSEQELLELVRCRSCAMEYAKRVGRSPGQDRSGIFPLAMTLKARQENGVIVPITFHCAANGCNNRGEPRRLFNIACHEPISPTGIEEMLKRIRCRNCAVKIASGNGRALGQRGSGVYPLIHTLGRAPWYDPCDPNSRRRLEHIIWDRQRRRDDL